MHVFSLVVIFLLHISSVESLRRSSTRIGSLTNTSLILVIVVPSVTFLLIVVTLAIYCYVKRAQRARQSIPSISTQIALASQNNSYAPPDSQTRQLPPRYSSHGF
ncbi:unnamed protein product [Adineta ricciae]|uniref:Uncharacterized protein n=1 Tax=Adineta ricciae TaxID=249248 RepID=A0A814GUG9_ADIRI|nr:unnamed protein product [Adineta ricciae]CAF1001159.1 unnamed protein product [Adineta ricciae]